MEKIKRHYYSIIQVSMFIEFYLNCTVGLRASSRVMSSAFGVLGENYDVPHWKTGATWAMKVGYYKLHHSKVARNKDWVWIIDHSIQLGDEKCLVILGIPKVNIPKDRALRKLDMTILHLSIMQSSNGDLIYDILKELSQRLNIVPCQIISDEGTDLVKGIKLFAADHPKCRHTSDIKHKIAAWFKNNIGTSSRWEELLKNVASSRKKMQQTALASLCAPKLKSKARYMNIGEITNWAYKILTLIDNEYSGYDKDLVEEYLGWVKEYREDISVYVSINEMTSIIDDHIKRGGLSRDTKSKLESLLPNDNTLSVMGQKFKSDMLSFVESQTSGIKKNERIVGCTEILESTFSDLKRISGQHSKSGFTRLILVLPAFIGGIDENIIREAMDKVSNKDIKEWADKNIKRSLQSERNRFAKWVKSRTKNADKFEGQHEKVA